MRLASFQHTSASMSICLESRWPCLLYSLPCFLSENDSHIHVDLVRPRLQVQTPLIQTPTWRFNVFVCATSISLKHFESPSETLIQGVVRLAVIRVSRRRQARGYKHASRSLDAISGNRFRNRLHKRERLMDSDRLKK